MSTYKPTGMLPALSILETRTEYCFKTRGPQAGWHSRQACWHWRLEFLLSAALLAPATSINFNTAADHYPEFAQGRVDPHEAGKQGGHTNGSDSGSANSGGDNYKPTEHNVMKKDGEQDGRTK
jgi:hypothetical protein